MKKVTFIDEERKNDYQRNHRNFIINKHQNLSEHISKKI